MVEKKIEIIEIIDGIHVFYAHGGDSTPASTHVIFDDERRRREKLLRRENAMRMALEDTLDCY